MLTDGQIPRCAEKHREEPDVGGRIFAYPGTWQRLLVGVGHVGAGP
jgi:hypothetical protein